MSRGSGGRAGIVTRLALLACALASASLAAASGRRPAPAGPRELEGAYPVEVRSKGIVREFTIRAAPARLILVEDYQNPATPRSLAEATGARMVVLPTQPGPESYLEFFDRIVEALAKAAE